MIELLMLDVRTLAFTSGVSGLLMAATMAGLYVAGMRSRALIDWSIAGLVYALGYFTGHVLQTVAVPFPLWVGGALANSLIVLGHGMVLVGVQRYLDMPARTGLVIGVFVAMFASVFAFPELRETLRLRIIFHSGFYVLFDAWAGILLWRTLRPGMRHFHRAVAVVLLIFAAFLATRLLYAVISPTLTTSFVQDPMQMSSFFMAMVFGFCLTMALAVMMFREKQVELMALAEKDPLTGMNNRLSLDHVAERHMQHAADQGTELAVMLLDIDHFKRINDEYGHQAGDRALCEIARRIDQVVRDTDVAFRFGGEEFLILLPGASQAQAGVVAERLREAIDFRPFATDGESIHLTASIGMVMCRIGRERWEDCVRRADQALYRAKAGGRNRVERAG